MQKMWNEIEWMQAEINSELSRNLYKFIKACPIHESEANIDE